MASSNPSRLDELNSESTKANHGNGKKTWNDFCLWATLLDEDGSVPNNELSAPVVRLEQVKRNFCEKNQKAVMDWFGYLGVYLINAEKRDGNHLAPSSVKQKFSNAKQAFLNQVEGNLPYMKNSKNAGDESDVSI
jgi:hypothetical protein